MSYVYDDFGNLKDNCLIVKPISKPLNIRGLRSDGNWSIKAIHEDTKNNVSLEVNCIFWTKKEALNFLKFGFHKSNTTNELLYKIKN
tara:strand:+ start:3454 stop:3714 length:261 start_codon:yes stop_codon:yes gene_type:complete